MSIPSSAALVTGASRGLGRALPPSWSATAARSSSTPDTSPSSSPPSRRWPATMRRSCRSPGTSPTRPPRRPRHGRGVARWSRPRRAQRRDARPVAAPAVERLPLDDLRATLETNLVAQVGLVQALLPHLRPGATIVAVTSDAAVEAYEGWGAYAAAKAGFEQLPPSSAAERPDLRVLRVDPGDMRTQMHQDAFPGEDISDRPAARGDRARPAALIDGPFPSGRYRASEVPASAGGGVMAAVVAAGPRRWTSRCRAELIADAPVEAEGRRRDDVRMLVAQRSTGRAGPRPGPPTWPGSWRPATCSSSTPRPRCLPPSPAATAGWCVHLSTDLGGGRWVVEVREPCGPRQRPPSGRPGQAHPRWPAARSPTCEVPHSPADERGARLWVATCSPPCRSRPGWPARAARSATAAPTRPGRSTPTRRSSPVTRPAIRARLRRDAVRRPVRSRPSW